MSLSDKIGCDCHMEAHSKVLHVDHVKEFIRELKMEFRTNTNLFIIGSEIIDKLAGKELTNG